MENLDALVKLITDRLLENLNSTPLNKSVLLIGGTEETTNYVESLGYSVVDSLQLTTEAVVVESTTIDSLLRVASLCPTTDEESALVTALLKGVKVCVLNKAVQIEEYKKTASPLLYRELLNQKQKLEKYGVHFCEQVTLSESNRVSDAIKVSDASHVQMAAREVVLTKDKSSKLVTESKIKELNLQEGDVFVAPKGMIVTALAKDYLKRHRITLKQEK